jgi:hypothetical protein
MTVPDQQGPAAGTPAAASRPDVKRHSPNDFALEAALQGSLQGELTPGRPSPVNNVRHRSMQNRVLTAE